MSNEIEIEYKVRKEYCSCCRREFDYGEGDEEEAKSTVYINRLVKYLGNIAGTKVYAEDLVHFADDFLMEELNEYVSFGDVISISKEERNRFLTKVYQYLKETSVRIVNEQYLIKHLGLSKG